MEGYVKGGFDLAHKLSGGSELYGALTGVGERTYNAPPPLVGGEASSFDVEDAYIGWRSGTSLGLGENALDFVVGRTQYKLGHGMLIYDGASEGGSRGGFWSGARKAFELAAIGRVKAGNTTIEGFYLERDELPENDSNSKTYGLNFEYSWNEDNTLGATYTSWSANALRPNRATAWTCIDLRAYLTPFPSLKALSFELEYAKERQRQPDRFQRVERAGRLAIRRRVEAEAVLSLRRVRRRQSEHREERGLRWTVDRLLRLGHLVAG